MSSLSSWLRALLRRNPARVDPSFDPAAATWTYVGNSAGEPFWLEPGIELWTHAPWLRSGTRVRILDPLYGAAYEFDVYEIDVEGRRVRFAAGEFSNGIWGFYVPA